MFVLLYGTWPVTKQKVVFRKLGHFSHIGLHQLCRNGFSADESLQLVPGSLERSQNYCCVPPLHSHRQTRAGRETERHFLSSCQPETVSEVLKQLESLWTQHPWCLQSHWDEVVACIQVCVHNPLDLLHLLCYNPRRHCSTWKMGRCKCIWACCIPDQDLSLLSEQQRNAIGTLFIWAVCQKVQGEMGCGLRIGSHGWCHSVHCVKDGVPHFACRWGHT